MKYRRLSMEELQTLEKEFVDFLVVNGITADDWINIKSDDSHKAEKIIDLFSDVVYESFLRKVEYLEIRSKKEVKVIQCLQDIMVMVGMKVDSPSADLKNPDFIKKASEGTEYDVEWFTAEKKYKGEREAEIFKLMEQGALATDGKLYKALCLAMADSSAG